jgi:His Kinase A (phospho-acceptor) domain
MTSSLPASAAPPAELPEDILDALLYSVSHDLRSPLLTLSLSAELIRESIPPELARDGGTAAVALDALKNGAHDLERMLHALTAVSRARRRPLESRRVPLRMLLGGHVVLSDAVDLERLIVVIDPDAFRELLDRLCGEDPAKIRLELTDTHVVCRVPARVELPPMDASPLLELSRSLQTHAGSIVETLASLQVQSARQSVAFEVDGDAVRVWLPLARNGR